MKLFRLPIPVLIILAGTFTIFLTFFLIPREQAPILRTLTLLSPDMLTDKSITHFDLAVHDLQSVIPLLSANGGLETVKGSAVDSAGLTLSIHQYSSDEEIEKTFLGKNAHIIAIDAATLSRDYADLSNEYPAVFMAVSKNRSRSALLSNVPIESFADLENEKISYTEKSKAFFLVRTLAKAADIPLKKTEWIEEKNTTDLESSFINGKARIAAFENYSGADPNNSKEILSTDLLPDLLPVLLVARKTDIARNEDAFIRLSELFFASLSELSALSVDAAHEKISPLISSSETDTAHPVLWSMSYKENLKYFSLEYSADWGFFDDYALGAAANFDIPLPSMVLYPFILKKTNPVKTNPVKTNILSRTIAPYTGKTPIVIWRGNIVFDENSRDISLESHAACAKCAQDESLFPAARIVIAPDRIARDPYTISVRQQFLHSLLIQKYKIPSSRIDISRDGVSPLTLILVPSVK